MKIFLELELPFDDVTRFGEDADDEECDETFVAPWRWQKKLAQVNFSGPWENT